MPEQVQAIPAGSHSLTPYLRVRGAVAAIEFYKKAFDAVEMGRLNLPDGKTIMHAQLKIGDSFLMLSDENPQWRSLSPLSIGGTGTVVHLYVPDADAVFAKAVAAGAKVVMPVQLMFWGDRYGMVVDPFGHEWSIATHVEEVSMEEMGRRTAKMFADGKDMPKECV